MLFRSTPAGTLTVAAGQGNGTFQVVQTTPLVSAVTLAIADATGDGRDDVIVLDATRVLVYPGQADGSFANSYTFDLFWNQGLTFTAADFTGDGKLDLAVTHRFGMTEILRGNPPTGFVRTGTIPNQQLSRGIAVDLDDNGTAELLLPGAGSKIGGAHV